MFTNLIQLITRRPPSGGDQEFVKEVHIVKPVVRNPRIERRILAGWVLILVKSWVIIWAVDKYRVSVDPLWVIGPTVFFALVCTVVYFRGE